MKCDRNCEECIFEDCIAQIRVRSEKSAYKNRTEAQKQRDREYQKKKRDEARKKGLCIVCRKRKATHGSKCYECYIRQKRYDWKKNTGSREYWRENGLCYFCGNEVIDGKKTCERHYNILTQNKKRLQNAENTKRARQRWKKWMWGNGLTQKSQDFKNG